MSFNTVTVKFILHEFPKSEPDVLQINPLDSFSPQSSELRSEQKKKGDAQKLPINKRSTIFVQSLYNWVKIIASWGNHFQQVS